MLFIRLVFLKGDKLVETTSINETFRHRTDACISTAHIFTGELIGDNVIIKTHDHGIVISTIGERCVKANCQFFNRR